MAARTIEETKAFSARHAGTARASAGALRWLPYLVLAGLFAWSVSRCYLPGKGFSYFIEFGEMNHARYLPEVNATRHYELPNSPGYDAQWYVQIAMRPRPSDPALEGSVDILRYRARRILFEWTAWALGGGDPGRIMNIFALQNVASWFLLAALLLRWFPPKSWGNAFRWASVLFSVGLIFSVRAALLDGPSLLLVAAGMALVESGHPWWAASVFGICGLGKDTSVLCGSALGPRSPCEPRAWGRWLSQLALVLAPVLLWTLCLWAWLGSGNSAGTHNFSAPFAGMARKAAALASSMGASGGRLQADEVCDLLALASLLLQALFFTLRVRWADPWWRLGASCVVLSAFLGDSVWGNYPTAAARVLLPMTLAFNVLVPRGGAWPLLLVLGNIGALGSPGILAPPPRGEYFMVRGDRELSMSPDGRPFEAEFGPQNWYLPEEETRPGRRTADYWRWSQADAAVVVRNPQAFTVVAEVSFSLGSADNRRASLCQGERVLWSGPLRSGEENPVDLPALEFPPGQTELVFRSDRPATAPGAGDTRRFAFSLRNLRIVLKGKRGETPAAPGS